MPAGFFGFDLRAGIGAGGRNILFDLGYNIRLVGGDVVLFSDVVFEIIQLKGYVGAVANGLPVAHSYGLHQAAGNVFAFAPVVPVPLPV